MPAIASRRRVAVVGAGVMGCATAFRLARAGLDVVLIERDAIAAHASGSNAGNLNPLYGTPPALLPLTLQAFRSHTEIRVELEQMGCAHYDLQAVKRIFLGRDRYRPQELEGIAQLFNSTAGFSASWVNGQELRALEPRLAPDLACGVVTEGALSIDSHAFTLSLARAARQLGATIIQEAVVRIVARGDRVTGVKTNSAFIACDEVVFATGPWVADIQTWLGIEVPIEPVKGELLVIRLPGEPLRYDFTLGEMCLYRRGQGEMWIGGTKKRCGFDSAPSEAERKMLLAGAERIIPGIRYATHVDHVAALRPVTESQAPIAERAAGWQNVYLANGGGAKGVLLSVSIAQTICDILDASHTA